MLSGGKNMDEILIGGCGAYCKTCGEFRGGRCKGCTVGYRSGERDLTKAKCKIKRCCCQKALISCADCHEYESCETIQSFHGHKGYKYGKYKQAVLYIKAHGYAAFTKIADTWKNAYGKYPD